MLRLEHFLGKGATRLCFYHPDTPEKCVKVAMRHKNMPQLQHELQAVRACKDALSSYLPEYDPELVPTTLGPGLVCEIIRNDDGSLSPSLSEYARHTPLNKRLMAQILLFARTILEHNIPLYDFNPANFVVQTRQGRCLLRLTDLKTYNSYKPWVYLHLELVVPALSKLIVKRRLKRLCDWATARAEK